MGHCYLCDVGYVNGKGFLTPYEDQPCQHEWFERRSTYHFTRIIN